MRTRALVLVTLLTAALAGCVGGENVTTVEDLGGNATPDEGSGPGENVNETEDVPPPPPEPVDEDVSFSGSTGTFVCELAATGECQGQFSEDATRPLEYEGTPLRVAGTLTWNVSSPTAQQMTVSVFALEEDGSFDYQEPFGTARGASPLAFDFDLTEAVGRDLLIDVSSVQEAGPVFASVSQEFSVDATLTYRPEA